MKTKDYAIRNFKLTQHAIDRYIQRIEKVKPRRVRPLITHDLKRWQAPEHCWLRIVTTGCKFYTKKAGYVFENGHLVTVLEPRPFGKRFVNAQKRAWSA